MDNLIPARIGSDRPYYSAHFMDIAIWEACVRLVCERHGFGCKQVHPGFPGTFPTFIVDLESTGAQQDARSIVVKLFGPLFDGGHSFAVERAMGHYLVHQPLLLRSPAILAEGQLESDWSYLIFEHVSGVSFGLVRQQLSQQSRRRMAEQMGVFMKQLHTRTATRQPGLPMPCEVNGWEGFVAFLETQRANCFANHQYWKDLPAQLLGQVQDYLLPVEKLLDLASPAHLIHADLTGDHLLGRLVPGENTAVAPRQLAQEAEADWNSLAIIDWGDTQLGNILYELVALHLDLFQADKDLLLISLGQYGLSDFYQLDFAHKAFNMVLLYQFPIPARVYTPYKAAQTLNELAEGLFGV